MQVVAQDWWLLEKKGSFAIALGKLRAVLQEDAKAMVRGPES